MVCGGNQVDTVRSAGLRLHRPEQGFRVRGVVGDPGPREGSEDAQFFQAAFQRGCPQFFEKPAARRCRYRHGGSAAAAGPC